MRPPSYSASEQSRAIIVDSLTLGIPATPSIALTVALVHRAVARQRRVLLVQREHAAAQALVLQRAAQHAGVGHRAPVVGEAGRADRAQLGHLGELAAVHARA